jgi:hypothetical protein
VDPTLYHGADQRVDDRVDPVFEDLKGGDHRLRSAMEG